MEKIHENQQKSPGTKKLLQKAFKMKANVET